MREYIYIIMCFVHRLVRKLMRRNRDPINVRFVDVSEKDICEDNTVVFQGMTSSQTSGAINGKVPVDQVYPVENAVPLGSNTHLCTSFTAGHGKIDNSKTREFSVELWRKFIDRADIPKGYRNEGLKYAGYISSGRESWCLPSWIWTNAAIVRYLCAVEEVEQAVLIGEKLLSKQEPNGGWVVRSDFSINDEIPVLAPNDSAYIGNNAFLELYKKTGDLRYLRAAINCADWIMSSARPDGLVWDGYNLKEGVWLKKSTIVDTGFTAGLFANLYILTGDKRYGSFLERFVQRFVEVFFDPQTRCFATCVDESGKRTGGRFARGQAWALEGLIPAFRALNKASLKETIQSSVNSIVRLQLPNGGWSYNFDRPYLGEDCKGVPVIAKALLDWHYVNGDTRIQEAVNRALKWCALRTSLSESSLGGIFSFNCEGAVVHNFYTETAFVYSSAYALETWKLLNAND